MANDKAKRSKKRACLEKIGGGDYSNAKLITRMQINCCPFACLQLGKRINLSFLCSSAVPFCVYPSIRLSVWAGRTALTIAPGRCCRQRRWRHSQHTRCRQNVAAKRKCQHTVTHTHWHASAHTHLCIAMTNKLPSASGNGRDSTLATKNLVVASSFELTVRTRYRGGNNARACSNELLAERGSVKICSLYPRLPLLHTPRLPLIPSVSQLQFGLNATLVVTVIVIVAKSVACLRLFAKNLNGISQHYVVYKGVHQHYRKTE